MAFPDVQPDADARAPAGGFGRLMACYAFACLVAVVLLPLILFSRDLVALGPAAAGANVSFDDLAAIVIVGFPVVFVFAAPFATALIVATQALRRTGLAVYLVGGAVIGPLVGLIAHMMPAITPAMTPTPWGSYLLYALVGLASAAVFWYCAIRPARRPR